MKTWYQSMTMGNLVHTRREVIAQIFESIFKYHTMDLKWNKTTI